LQIKINGKIAVISESNTLMDLVAQKKLNAAAIIVEHNLKIIPPSEWPATVLQPDDAIEILTFVGGG